MSNLSNSNIEQMLYLFVDGELPPTQEESLFAELANNDGLRNEMKDLMAMRDAVSSDLEAFNPPPVITSQIYKKIGFVPPMGIVSQAPSSLIYFRKYIVAAAALLIVGAVSYFGYNSYNTNLENLSKVKLSNQNTSINSSNNNIKTEIPTVSSNEIENKSINSNKKENTKAAIKESKNNKMDLSLLEKKISEKIQFEEELNKETIDNQNINITKFNNSPIIALDNLVGSNSIQSISGPSNNYPNTPLPFNMEIGKVKLYDVSIRGMAASSSFPAITQTSAIEPALTNLALGLYMHQWNNFRLGVEFGQEPFGQEFKDQSQISYVNKSSLLWGAIGLHGEMDNPLINNSQLYSRVLLGSSEVGPLGKVILGIQYQPELVGYSIQFGVEGSMVSYQNQGLSYLSKKIGITYGLSWTY